MKNKQKKSINGKWQTRKNDRGLSKVVENLYTVTKAHWSEYKLGVSKHTVWKQRFWTPTHLRYIASRIILESPRAIYFITVAHINPHAPFCPGAVPSRSSGCFSEIIMTIIAHQGQIQEFGFVFFFLPPWWTINKHMHLLSIRLQ